MANRSNAARQKRSLRQRRTEARRTPVTPAVLSANGEQFTVDTHRLQHDEATVMAMSAVEDSDGVLSQPVGRITDTLSRLKAGGSIDDASHAAGLRLQDLAVIARLEPLGSMPLERVSCSFSDGPMTDAMVQARKDLRAAFECLGTATFGALIVRRCICEGLSIGAFRELERRADGTMHNRMYLTGFLARSLERLAVEFYGEEGPKQYPSRAKSQCLRNGEIWGLAGQN